MTDKIGRGESHREEIKARGGKELKGGREEAIQGRFPWDIAVHEAIRIASEMQSCRLETPAVDDDEGQWIPELAPCQINNSLGLLGGLSSSCGRRDILLPKEAHGAPAA